MSQPPTPTPISRSAPATAAAVSRSRLARSGLRRPRTPSAWVGESAAGAGRLEIGEARERGVPGVVVPVRRDRGEGHGHRRGHDRGGLGRAVEGLGERLDQLPRARRALGGVHGEPARQGRVEGRGQPGADLGGARARVAHVGEQDRARLAPEERRPAGEGLEGHGREGVDVGALGGGVALHLLGGDVLGRAQPVAAAGEAGHVVEAHEPEVAQPGAAGLQQDVGGLDVAVDRAVGVGEVERLGDVRQHVERLGARQRPGAGHALGQRVAGHEAHGDEGPPVDLAGVVDRHDPGVLEAPRGDRLAAEALRGPRSLQVAVVEDLQGHLAVQVDLRRAVDDRLAAAADLRLDAVAPERLSWNEPHAVLFALGAGPPGACARPLPNDGRAQGTRAVGTPRSASRTTTRPRICSRIARTSSSVVASAGSGRSQSSYRLPG